MKFIDEYRDGDAARKYARALKRITTRPWTLMEVCGGQTHAIVKFGVDELLPANVDTGARPRLSGLRDAARADREGAGDCRPAGRHLLFLRRHAARARPRDGSPLGEGPRRRRAHRLLAAGCRRDRAAESRSGSGVLRRRVRDHRTGQCHGRVPGGAGRAAELLDARVTRPGAARDGGHPQSPRAAGCRRSWRRGTSARSWASPNTSRWRRSTRCRSSSPASSRWTSCRASTCASSSSKKAAPRWRISTRGRSSATGNLPARQLVREVFEVVPRKWRGVGEIPSSGLGLRPHYRRFDAEYRFGVADQRTEEPTECMSGLIMQGRLKPHECPAFGTVCTPEHPLGATMVSNEGACAAYYRYRRVRLESPAARS